MYFLVAIYRNDFSRQRNPYDLSPVMVYGVWSLDVIVVDFVVAGLDGFSFEQCCWLQFPLKGSRVRSIDGPVWFANTLIMKVQLGYARLRLPTCTAVNVGNPPMRIMNGRKLLAMSWKLCNSCLATSVYTPEKWYSNRNSAYKLNWLDISLDTSLVV